MASTGGDSQRGLGALHYAEPVSGQLVVSSVPTPLQASAPTAIQAAPTPLPAPPTTTIATRPLAPPPNGRVLFANSLASPVPDWPNNPDGSAWFGQGAFRLFARQAGRFVAVGVPLPEPVGDAVVSARFRKVDGPPGGGYGLIVRDQGSAAERDGRNLAGQYLVLEVSDRGDAGIWQRAETNWIDVMPWTHSEAVHTDLAINILTIALRGSALRFDVNGQVLADLTYDGVPPRGGVGIFVGGDLNDVALESLRIEIS